MVGDEGTYYIMDTNGRILDSRNLGKYDFEGAYCEKDRFVFAIENGDIVTKSRTTDDIKIYISQQKYPKKNSIEGITKINGHYLLALQTKKKSESKLIEVKLQNDLVVKLGELPADIIDNSGLEYDGRNIYLLSNTKDMMYIYDMKTKEYKDSVKLPKFAQEGIAIDFKNEIIYFADDDGAVYKYTFDEFGM